MDNLEPQEEQQAPRHYARVMAFAVLGVFLIGIGLTAFYSGQTATYQKQVLQNEREGTTTTIARYARSAPSRLRIPKLSLDTTFETPLRLNEDKSIQVPKSYDKVGWYEYGATPGEVGPAVILGHVDSYQGAAVFYHLGQLKKGDEIAVDREDGTTATFVVEYMGRYPQDSFPTDLVYGKTTKPTLRLITCSGIFNKGIQKYSHNLVVYAILKEDSSADVLKNKTK